MASSCPLVLLLSLLCGFLSTTGNAAGVAAAAAAARGLRESGSLASLARVRAHPTEADATAACLKVCNIQAECRTINTDTPTVEWSSMEGQGQMQHTGPHHQACKEAICNQVRICARCGSSGGEDGRCGERNGGWWWWWWWGRRGSGKNVCGAVQGSWAQGRNWDTMRARGRI